MKRLLRKAVGMAANWFPNVVFYSRETRVKFNNTLSAMPLSNKDGEATSAIGRAALAMCAAVGENMEAGDVATCQFEEITVDTGAIGNFKVTIEKIT